MENHMIKLKENEKGDKFEDLARELKRLRNMRVTMIPIITIGITVTLMFTRYSQQRIGKGTGGFGNKRTSGDNLKYSIVEIGHY